MTTENTYRWGIMAPAMFTTKEEQTFPEYLPERLAALIQEWSRAVRLFFKDCSGVDVNSEEARSATDRVVDGLIVIWLAASRYRLVERDNDFFAALLGVYEYVTNRQRVLSSLQLPCGATLGRVTIAGWLTLSAWKKLANCPLPRRPTS